MKTKLLIFTCFIILIIIGLTVISITNPLIYVSKIKLAIPVKEERLKQDVHNLTSIIPARHYRNLSSLERASNYIFDEFSKTKCSIEIQGFQVNGKPYQNLICSFGPLDSPRIIVGAHYDVAGDQPGADDNASGIAGVLEIARLLHELSPSLKHRVDLVAYTLEEPPFFATDSMGSAIHANSLKEKQVPIHYMISLEMIGYFSQEKNSQQYPTFVLKLFYPTQGDFITLVGKLSFSDWKLIRLFKQKMSQVMEIDVFSINAPQMVTGTDFSDHRNFWNRGIPAVMITDTAFYRNSHYHQASDTMDTLDFERMSEVIRGVYWVLVN